MPQAQTLETPAARPLLLPEEGEVWCFVCSGNTCRSPMAAAVANALLASRGIRAVSAGLAVARPAPIAPNAVRALETREIIPTPDNDYRRHVATPLGEGLLNRADRVFGMTDSHAMAILTAFPRFAAKLSPLGVSIPDPYGGDLDTYLRALDAILEAIKKL